MAKVTSKPKLSSVSMWINLMMGKSRRIGVLTHFHVKRDILVVVLCQIKIISKALPFAPNAIIKQT